MSYSAAYEPPQGQTYHGEVAPSAPSGGSYTGTYQGPSPPMKILEAISKEFELEPGG